MIGTQLAVPNQNNATPTIPPLVIDEATMMERMRLAREHALAPAKVKESKPPRKRGRPRKHPIEATDATSNAVSAAVVSRKRGRPRKDAEQQVVAKRPRGRPRKDAAPVTQVVAKRPRGRPRKDASPVAQAVEKRPRGRPRKDAAPVTKPPQEVVVKRPRGRPRKDAPPITQVVAKRPRGRPRKDASPIAQAVEKRPRGRPRKDAAPVTKPAQEVVAKRPRGRPRKDAAPITQVVAKRPRGRPRKESATTIEAAAPTITANAGVAGSAEKQAVPMYAHRPEIRGRIVKAYELMDGAKALEELLASKASERAAAKHDNGDESSLSLLWREQHPMAHWRLKELCASMRNECKDIMNSLPDASLTPWEFNLKAKVHNKLKMENDHVSHRNSNNGEELVEIFV